MKTAISSWRWLLLLAALYIAQGLPAGLFAHALPTLWRTQGVDLVWIGALKLLALPWVLKALWAPWLDARLQSGWSWKVTLMLLQSAFAAGLFLLALGLGDGGLGEGEFGEGGQGDSEQAPGVAALWPLMLLIGLINLFAATQDIITDGLAVRRLPPAMRGLANSLQVTGYKVGMLAGGSGLLFVLAWLDGSMALVLLGLLVLALLLPLALGDWAESRPAASPIAVAMATNTATSKPQDASARDWRSGFWRSGMGLWLLLVAAFKVADSLGSAMIKPMLVDLGWQLPAIAQQTLMATLAGLAGAVFGGMVFRTLGAWHSLMWSGLAQALGIAAYALLPGWGGDPWGVYLVSMGEQFADGWSSVALFAAMMGLCRQAWAGADYTLLASLQVVAAGVFGLVGGWLAGQLGYSRFFVVAGALGLLVQGILWGARYRLARWADETGYEAVAKSRRMRR